MSEPRTFQFTYNPLTDRSKVLKKLDDGWYIVNLGAVNAFNANGEYYLADNMQELITNENKSALARKLKSGLLDGEKKHPAFLPGMSKMDFFIRNLQVDEDRVSHTIRNIKLVELNYKDTYKGKVGPYNMIQIVGEVKPIGKFKDELEERLSDPTLNAAFSIRSFTDNFMKDGTLYKKITNIITFDYVGEPGIKSATKYNTSTECYRCEYSDEELKEIIGKISSEGYASRLGLESNGVVDSIQDLNTYIKSTSSGRYSNFDRWAN